MDWGTHLRVPTLVKREPLSNSTKVHFDPVVGVLWEIQLQVIQPSPITRSEARTLAELVGAKLSGVDYCYLPWSDSEPGYSGGEDGVDSELEAVALHFDDGGSWVITWAMDGEFEGLAVLPTSSYPGVASETLEASNREAWRRHLGGTVESVAASWQISGEECPESLWAIRLDFTAGPCVIALGMTSPNIDYTANELLIIHDASLARAFRPPHVRDSAWGSPIERA